MKNIYNVYLENLKKTDHPEDLVVEERITMDFDTRYGSVYGRTGYT